MQYDLWFLFFSVVVVGSVDAIQNSFSILYLF